MSSRVASVFLVPILLAPITARAQSPADSAIGFRVAPMQPGFGVAPMESDPSSRAAAGAVGNMTYHNGGVQHTQKVFTIFWNPSGPPFPAGYQNTINQFVQDLNGSPYYSIASQYNDFAGYISPVVLYGGT